MGCGGSVPISRATRNDLQYFDKHPKLREKRESLSIEEARKRREECAKERTRRASLMGQLEAEKLIQRKRSNASMFNISAASDLSEETRIPTFEPNGARTVKELQKAGDAVTKNGPKGEQQSSTKNMYKNGNSQSANERKKITKIEITLSSASRPSSSKAGTSAVYNFQDRTDYESQLPGMTFNTNETKNTQEGENLKNFDFEEKMRRQQAKDIVEKAIENALAKVNSS